MTTPQPGWYDDPQDPNAQRYWDGQQWTPRRLRKPKSVTPLAPTVPPQIQPPSHLQPTNHLLAKLRSNQLALHLIGGTLGGAAGALLAELVNKTRFETRVESVVDAGLWFSICSAVTAAALFVSAEWYQRRALMAGRVLKVLLFGAIAGFVSGAVAQGVFLIHIGSGDFQNYVLRSFCWGLAGSMIGGLLSRTIPNLGLSRGSAAGFIGGCGGGILFVLVSNQLPETWGRVVGVGSLGLALGLAMYLVENLFREASLEVTWAYNETTRVSLGAQPITIGGDVEDTIFLRGLPPQVSSIVLHNGQIEHLTIRTALVRR
jgi:hypothetical protein